jgi:hypothetical protein
VDWNTLLATLVGALAAILGGFLLQRRVERRRQIGGVRRIASQLSRSSIEISAVIESSSDSWFEGPHAGIQTDAWDTHAADLIGRLSPADFDLLDTLHRNLGYAAEWGMTRNEGPRLRTEIDDAEKAIASLATPTWFDRHVWRI